MNWIKTLGATCALGTLVVSMPAAAASCWDDSQISAVRVRDFQTMLMATTLRCNALGMNISDHYNGFVTARRDQLNLANAAIRQKFTKDGGQVAYDHFTTALANAYGDGSTNRAACDEAAATADDAAATPDALFELAAQRLTPPDAEAGRCTRHETLAANEPPAAKTAAAAASMMLAPEPTPKAAITLASSTSQPAAPSSAEVAAAIAVLSRYQAVQTASAQSR